MASPHSFYPYALGRLLRAYRIQIPLIPTTPLVPDPEDWNYLSASYDGSDIVLVEHADLTMPDNTPPFRLGLNATGETRELGRRPYHQAPLRQQRAALGLVDEVFQELWLSAQDPTSELASDPDQRTRALQLIEAFADPSVLRSGR